MTVRVWDGSEWLSSPNITLSIASSAWQVKTTNFSAIPGERYIVDSSSADVSITLPLTPISGSEITIIKSSAANELTISNAAVINSVSFVNGIVQITNISTRPTSFIYVNSVVGWLALPSSDIVGSITPDPVVPPSDAYATLVVNGNPYSYLRLDESSGTVATAQNGMDGTYLGTPTFQTTGLLYGSTNKAITFNPNSSSEIYIGSSQEAPTVYTAECIFKVNTGNYGGLVGFGNSPQQYNSGSYDRELYVKPDGKLEFYVSSANAIHTTSATVNDGNTHIASVVQHPGGIEIWLDKTLIYTHSEANAATYTGYWHIGNTRSAGIFNGVIDEVSITHSRIAQTDILARHIAALDPNTPAFPLPPAPDAYAILVANSNPYSYFRLNETSGLVANAHSGTSGTYLGTPTFQVSGLLYGSTNKAVQFSAGASTQVYVDNYMSIPDVCTLECIFKTTGQGGLLSFGNNWNQVNSGLTGMELYINSTGKLEFYIHQDWSSGIVGRLISPNSYNDDNPHITSVVLHAGGMELWVDNILVDTDSLGEYVDFGGYWHVGYAQGYPEPAGYFNGVIDEVSFTHSRVVPTDIQARHTTALNI